MSIDLRRASRLEALHGALFAAGLSGLLFALALGVPRLLLIAGPCLSLSGVLIWLGSRITFHGPLGDALRLALGRTRVVTLHVRAVAWVLIGLMVTAWGVAALRDGKLWDEPLWRQPLAHWTTD